MRSGLELHDSRVSHIEWVDGDAVIHFSHAYIHKSKGSPGKDTGTGWSQEAQLIMQGASSLAPSPPLPNTISEGYLEVGGQVYVKDDFVAEYIVYNIRERGSNRASISFTIDSFSSGFSRKNRDDLTAALKPYIAQCKNYSIPV